MAAIERYLVCASASSALNITTTGLPRRTVSPSPTSTLVTIPPTIGVTLTSRYALGMTLPGTWTDALDATAAIVAVLMPTLASASAGSRTSTSPGGSAEEARADGAA